MAWKPHKKRDVLLRRFWFIVQKRESWVDSHLLFQQENPLPRSDDFKSDWGKQTALHVLPGCFWRELQMQRIQRHQLTKAKNW